MRCNITLAIIVLLLFHSCIVSADSDYILNTAYFEDTSGTLPYETAKQQAYQTYQGMLIGGFTPSAYWIRLQIKAQPNNTADNNAILRIQPSQLDDITLYDEQEGDWKPQKTGDRYPLASSGYHSANLNFAIKLTENPRYIFLRLKTTSTNFMAIQLMDKVSCERLDLIQNTLYSLYLGALTVIFIIALTNAIITRSKLLTAFAIKQLIALIAMTSYTGYLKLLLHDALHAPLLDIITSFFIISYSLFSTAFYYILYQTYPTKRWVMPTIKATIYCYIIILGIWLFTSAMRGLQFNVILVTITFVIMVFIPTTGIKWDSTGRKKQLKTLLTTTQFISLATVVTTTVPGLGLIKGNLLATYAVLFHAAISSYLLLLMMQLSAKIKAEEKIIALTTAQTRADNEQQQRIEQGKFIALLAHEFKTPLSVLRLTVDSGQLTGKSLLFSTNAINSMNQLIERCVQMDKLTSGNIPVLMQHVAINALIQDEIAKIIDHPRIQQRLVKNIMIETDPVLFKTILSNLLDNAIKYGSKNHDIEVMSRTFTSGPRTLLSIVVKNKSLNNKKPDPDMLFKKYYRADFASEKSGTGLGLYLAKSLAVALNGDLRYSSIGNWVLFEIRLPLT